MKRVIKLGAGTFALRTPIVRVDQTKFLHPRPLPGYRLAMDYYEATVVTMADGRRLVARPWVWRILSTLLRLSLAPAPVVLSEEPVKEWQVMNLGGSGP
jgi:hypothetical protein